MITPMKRTKNNIANLKNLIDDAYSVQELQQRGELVENDYNYETPYTVKEIVSDYLLIFNSEIENNENSFSITYDFLDKDEENHSIQISTIANEQRKQSLFIEPKAFNQKLKELNKSIKNFKENNKHNNASNFIISEINNIFIQEEFNLELEVKKERESINNFLQTKFSDLNIEGARESYEDKKFNLETSKKMVRTAIEESPEYIELEKITKRMAFLQEAIKENTSALEEKHSIVQLNRLTEVAKTNFKAKETTLKEEEDMLLKNTKTIVRHKIKR
jgi:hypothetical protein